MQTSTENILDVRLLEPAQKHPAVFALLNKMTEGESLTIYNDHDPKPLYYQLLGEAGNIFTWNYLQEGPEWWKVKISKRLTAANGETVGQIAAHDLRKAKVFKKYGIDFCCGGKKTLSEVCAAKGLDITKVEQELQQANEMPSSRALPYEDWTPDFLADYIVNTHHSYVRKTLPDMIQYAEKVMKAHRDQHPELASIYQLITAVNTELMMHMLKEEKVLFPYIKELIANKNNQQSLYASHLDTVQNPINMMEMEHEMVGMNFEKIRTLTNNYLLPSDACGSYSFLYKLLNEFEDDLHLHIHLENNILFPKALELEKQLKQ